MKKILFLAGIIISLNAAAQNDTVFSKKVTAAINDWSGRTILFLPGYREMAITELKKALNEKLVNRIVNYSNQSTYPAGLTEILNVDNDGGKNDLKMYWVATYDNNYNGEFHGKEAVLWLPKEDNKSWKKDIIWQHDIFIVIPLADVELLGDGN